MTEQELFKYTCDRVFIQNADGLYYEETPENFEKDGGILPEQYMDYNKSLKTGVFTNKETGQVTFAYPDAEGEVNIGAIKEFLTKQAQRLYVALPAPTAEEIAKAKIARAKQERAEAVSQILVEVDGMIFDGDETAQTRMGRVISAAIALGADLNTEKRIWVLADNAIAEVTIAQLAEALRKAGDRQTELWTVPYEA